MLRCRACSIQTYRKVGAMKSHGRDIYQTTLCYYCNAFTDTDKHIFVIELSFHKACAVSLCCYGNHPYIFSVLYKDNLVKLFMFYMNYRLFSSYCRCSQKL